MHIHHASRIAEPTDCYVQESGMPLNSRPSLHEREKRRLTQDRDKDSHAVPIHHASRIAETTDFYVQESGMPLNSRPSLHEREKCRLTQDLVFMNLRRWFRSFTKSVHGPGAPLRGARKVFI